MAESEETKFEVIFTTSARLFFYELLDYLFNFYSFTRVEQISLELIDLALKLSHLYDRGTPEPELISRSNKYRYLLYNRTRRKDIKIIYYVDYQLRHVYVTDFFPTEMDNKKISRRSESK